MKNKGKKKKMIIIVLVVVAVLTVVQMVVLGYFGGIGPLGKLQEVKMRKHAGNAEKYAVENVAVLENSPLKGKNICFLGSSVTYGSSSLQVTFAEYIAKRNECTFVKEAVSGTTLVDNGKNSYIQRMLNNIDKNAEFDVFVCQLSTNDAAKKLPMGEVSNSTNLEDFDTSTIIGAEEYIIAYVKQTWNCPVVFYTGTKYDSEQYGQMVDALYELEGKWNIGVIDLWNDPDMNAVSEEDYALYMVDKIHPSQAGYLEWWTPKMETYLYGFVK